MSSSRDLILAMTTAIFSATATTPALPARKTLSPATSRSPLTVRDVVHMEAASQFDISPDGKWTVWVKTTPNEKKNQRQTNLMLTSLEDTITIQLTRGPKGDTSPRFSPDGSTIAFLRSAKKEKTQIYLLNFRGGEAEKLTSISTGVKRFSWRTSAEIIFTAREDSTLREKELKESKDDAIVVADQEHYPPVRLFSIDTKKKKVERLSNNQGQITEFSVSPDGEWVVTNENQDVNYRYDYRVPPKQFLMNITRRERREILTDLHVDPYDFKWANDGSGFYCRRSYASDSTATFVSIAYLYFFDLKTEKLKKVPLGWKKGLGHAYRIVERGVVVALANGTEDRIAYAEKKNDRYTKLFLSSPTQKPIALYAAKRDGRRLIYAVSDASTIPEVMTATIENGSLQNERKLVDLNEGLKKKKLAKTELISWRGAMGDRVEGILYYPVDYEEAKRYPLVTLIHGGPAGVDRNYFSERWSNYPHILASQGSFVLKANYHGSGNYGLKWVESIKGRYYEYEVPDILKGIRHLIKKGLVDKDKLGVIGWSNGSILAIECCLRSKLFKALCAGAGDVNWTSDYGNCAFGAAFDNAYFGGPPWKKLQTYIKKSPIFRMHKMKTPTIILFGAKDTNVPTEQGWQHFRAMQLEQKAPVRFILFPGAGHGLSKLSHQTRKMEEELAWLDKHLFGNYQEENEAFDENSLLAIELKKAKAKRSIGLFGIPYEHALVPEVVGLEGIKIGKFEVTRGQFRAFNMDYDFPPGTGNYPVNNVSFEDALSYCKWLSEKTGRNFRLPREEEMEKILRAARSNLANENNLDRWAGYPPTPEEREMLREKIAALEESRLLIEEVGTCKPVGKEAVYDLGGNVAEWVLDETGGGKIMGLSAVSPRDERTPYETPPLKYVGFRVCED